MKLFTAQLVFCHRLTFFLFGSDIILSIPFSDISICVVHSQ